MMNENNTHTGHPRLKTTAVFLLGAAIGAGLALLFAPASGSDTRRRVLNRIKNYADDVKKEVDAELARAKRKYEDPEKEFPV